MQLFLFGLLVLFNNFVLGSAQNSSSSEVIANGRQNCPAAGSPDYDIIPFYDSQGGMFSTNITSISIVPVNGGPAIAEFPINLTMPLYLLHLETTQTDYERPNIVIKFQVNDSRQGEWVITPEHWSGLWPASGSNTCLFFITAWPRQPSWNSDDFQARHFCIVRNMADKTIGLAGSSIIHYKQKQARQH
uniref:Uncharacterized protein n=1 Tax=Ditylenchus dipsaci TaxID=166011 RepID=A0A915D2Z1_9BILA